MSDTRSKDQTKRKGEKSITSTLNLIAPLHPLLSFIVHTKHDQLLPTQCRCTLRMHHITI